MDTCPTVHTVPIILDCTNFLGTCNSGFEEKSIIHCLVSWQKRHLSTTTMIDDGGSNVEYESMRHAGGRMTKEERRKKRLQEKLKEGEGKKQRGGTGRASTELSDGRFADLLVKNEDELLRFVAQVNNVYQDKLGKDAPFMTFVLLGMQSSGKSTLMERFLNAVLNIVQEGTNTRCPLDITCIHDDSCTEPSCELSGKELDGERAGRGLKDNDVFESITMHNRTLADEDRFSTESLAWFFIPRMYRICASSIRPVSFRTKALEKTTVKKFALFCKAECESQTQSCVCCWSQRSLPRTPSLNSATKVLEGERCGSMTLYS